MLKKAVCLMSMLGLIVLGGCARVPSKVGKEGEIKKTIDMPPHSDFIETIGIGAADKNLTNTTQRRALSREAAIVRAQYEMLCIIKGLQLTGEITVEMAMTTNSRLKAEIDTFIKGAEVIKTEWTNDDGAIVTLRLEKKRLDKILKQYQ